MDLPLLSRVLNKPVKVMIKGEAFVGKEVKQTLYTGLAKVRVVAVNPTRAEEAELYGNEVDDSKDEYNYFFTDSDGDDKVLLKFYLYSEELNKYFHHKIFITNKVRSNKAGDKNQYINSVMSTFYAEDQKSLPTYFKAFLDKDGNELAEKNYRGALVGEEDLANLVRIWLGRLKWSQPSANVQLDTDRLFKGDWGELRELIDSVYSAPFVALIGITTNDSDPTKQYHEVWRRGFLPGRMWEGVEKGFKFSKDYDRKAWAKFESEVEGEYGFKAFYKLEPIAPYNKAEDVAAASKAHTPTQGVTAKNNRY